MNDAVYFSDSKNLKDFANSISKKCTDPSLEAATYYYVLARYLVAEFEGRSYQIPIQVWNEYRNALDHLMRAFTQHQTNLRDQQIKAATKHLLRATLDVLKSLCTNYDDWYKGLSVTKTFDLYIFVDNGSFVASLHESYNSARTTMIQAKTQDLYLSNDDSTDMRIVESYLDAFFKYKQLENIFYEKQAVASISRFHMKLMKGKSLIMVFFSSMIGKIFGSILIFVFGFYIRGIIGI